MINESLIRDDYIVINTMKKFCNDNELGSIYLKEDGFSKIEEFYAKNDDNKKLVDEWLEKVLKEGQKYIYLRKISYEDNILKSELYWKDVIKKEFDKKNMEDTNKYRFSNDLEINKITYTKDEYVEKVNISMGLMVSEPIIKPQFKTRKIIYPIFVELDIKNDLLHIRIKSKSNIYKIKESNEDNQNNLGDKINNDSFINEVQKYLSEKFQFKLETIDKNQNTFYKAYYKVFDELTFTPEHIQKKIDSKKENVKKLRDYIFQDLNLDIRYKEDAQKDLEIWLEKFISLSEKDKSIFTNDRQGYPIKLIATDKEDTKIEEVSGDKSPLQSKGSFFDHKKIIKNEKSCDGMTLAYKRENTKYYGKAPFTVLFFYRKGNGVLRFQDYVEEEDINNVLSRIIKSI
ncbi:hypothetical protein K144316041_09480 [Clostridium tetani]|uniref:hypothetical protein n=1 Tax=Clostridium tetani TaxID=1513 RepID=UPI00295544EA|nr:hypothetical protein [Clostridium tetani]BDR72240.1 hypothetical protein K144316041_09480 [Clostridium tetani]